MIVIINNAILHILDFQSGVTVFSETELGVQSDSVTSFLTKHIEKISKDSNAKSGKFFPDSAFQTQLTAYLAGEMDFTDFSRYAAERTYAAIAQSDIVESADLVICDVQLDDERFVAMLKCNNKIGFTHQVVTNEDGKIRNEIINHYAILPNTSQKIDEYALINVSSLEIKFSDNKSLVDGETVFVLPEKILECTSDISPKTALNLVQAITRTISENHGHSSVAAVAKVKNFLLENAESSDCLDTLELGKELFGSSALMQEEYIYEVKKAGIPETVRVDKTLAVQKGKNHKIQTDTGIEVVFPVDYFHNKDYMEFINNPDGTISIALKNIGKILNK